MPQTNPILELRDVLQEIDTFLDGPKVQQIKELIAALLDIISSLGADVDFAAIFDTLIQLLNQIKTRIQNFDLSQLGTGDLNVETITELMGKFERLLNAIQALFPDLAGSFPNLNLLGSLEDIQRLKEDIAALIDKIVAQLRDLKAAAS